MERIPQPVFLPGTPENIIENIEWHITALNKWAASPGDQVDEIPKYKKIVEDEILLGTHNEIVFVWKALEKLESRYTNPYFEESVFEFSAAISEGLYGELKWAELPPKARATKHNDIIRTMRQLAKDIKYYDLDQRDLVSYGVKPCDGGFVAYDDETNKEEKPDKFISFQEIYDNQLGVQISDLLQKHADKLENQERHLTPLTSKTTGERALLHFIRTLAIHNKARYGEYHGAIISRVASVYFPNSETEPEKIRASIHALNL